MDHSEKKKYTEESQSDIKCCASREMTQLEILDQSLTFHLSNIERIRKAMQRLKDNPYLEADIKLFRNL